MFQLITNLFKKRNFSQNKVNIGNPIEQLYREYQSMSLFLKENGQISFYSEYNNSFRKVLLLSAGSYFEHEITNILSSFVNTKSNNDTRITSFLQKQAINGKYHQLFSWGKTDKPEEPGKNANTFWKLFGEEFSNTIKNDISKDPSISLTIEAFIEIGHLRNILVHSNFAAYNYDQKTTEEIFELYKIAVPFLDFLRLKLE